MTNTLIMTATITPPAGAPGLMRTDPKLRLEDYRSALIYYIGFLGKELDFIVFAENSNSDVSPLQSIVREAGRESEVEFLVFDGMDHPPDYGRCFSESQLLDHAMSYSKVVRSAQRGDLFWKVTGRYRLINLGSMMRTRPSGLDFYCDLRNSRSPWADMRFMAWTKVGYREVFEGVGQFIREDTNHGRPGEESLYRRLTTLRAVKGFVTSLKREPLFDGVRAFDNQNWSLGRQRLVYMLRQVQRIVLRGVWI